MARDIFFIPSNDSTIIIIFTPFSGLDSLPFPLYLSPPIKVVFSLVLLIVLAYGSKYRYIIFSYLRAPETKMGPINYLIWLDQVNGVFLGITLFYKAIVINLPFPLSDIIGATLCEWIDLFGSIYLVGSYIWSSCTAMYRIIYFKAQSCIVRVGGEKPLLKIFIFAGLFLHTVGALWLTVFDHRNSSEKLCSHYSNEEMIILYSYKVRFFYLYIY